MEQRIRLCKTRVSTFFYSGDNLELDYDYDLPDNNFKNIEMVQVSKTWQYNN